MPLEKALLCLNMLVEGSSVRAIERITGVHRDTVLDLMVRVGTKCERLMQDIIKDVPVKDVQADELWSYIGCKEKRKTTNDPRRGDAYCFVALERRTKMVLAWHLGRRTARDTVAFTEKLNEATSGRFQLTTDGFGAYPDAVNYSLGTRVHFVNHGRTNIDTRQPMLLALSLVPFGAILILSEYVHRTSKIII